MEYVDWDARLEEALAPLPITTDSRCVDPFTCASGLGATLMRHLLDEGLIQTRAFTAYRQKDAIKVMKPAAYRLFGEVRRSWEQLMTVEMSGSGTGEEALIVDNMLDAFLQLAVLLASMSPYLSTEDTKGFIRKPYQFTSWALARNNRTSLALR